MYLYSDIVRDEVIVPGTSKQYDMPVNPISHINIEITATLAGSATDPLVGADLILKAFPNLEVNLRGATIIGGSAETLARYGTIISGAPMSVINLTNTADYVTKVNFTIPFGRGLYLADECLPAVRRGELKLAIEYGGLPAGVTSSTITISTCELPGADPAAFLKVTPIEKEMQVAIANDIELPIGNPILGCLLRADYVPIAGGGGYTCKTLELLTDNVEQYANPVSWETLRQMYTRRAGTSLYLMGHRHYYDPSLPARLKTEGPIQDDDYIDAHYSYLDLDPILSGGYALQTANRSRCNLRVHANVDSYIEVSPVEYITVTKQGPTSEIV